MIICSKSNDDNLVDNHGLKYKKKGQKRLYNVNFY